MTQRPDDKFEADLSAYLDGELSPERTREIEQHLAESESARRLLDELRDVADRVSGLPHLRAPDELTTAMARHAERRVLFGDERPPRRARTIRLFAQMSASAAVLAACAFVGWELLRTAEAPAPSSVPPTAVTRSEEKSPPVETPVAAPAKEPVLALAPAQPAEEFVARERAASGATGQAAAPAVAAPIAPAAIVAESGAKPAEFLASKGAVVGAPAIPASQTEPLVDVSVRPQNMGEYEATLALLDLWAAPPEAARNALAALGLPAVQAGGRLQPVSVGGTSDVAVEMVYQIPLSEIERCLTQLAENTPERVSVQMTLPAEPSDAAAQPGAKPAPTVLAFRLPRKGEEPIPILPPEPKDADERYGAPPTHHDTVTSTPYSPGEATRKAEERLTGVCRGGRAESAPTGGGAGAADKEKPAQRRGFLNPNDQQQARERLSKRHRAATEEPEVVIVPVPGATPTQPGAAPPTLLDEEEPAPTSAPATTQPAAAEPSAGPAEETPVPSVAQQIIDALRRRNLAAASRPANEPTAESAPAPASQPTSQPTSLPADMVLFRVQIFPPPACASQPTSQPAAP